MKSKNITVYFTGKNLRQRRKETIINPPLGVKFHTTQPIKTMPADYEKGHMTKALNKGILGRIIKLFRIPNIRYIPYSKTKKSDIIYTPGQLLLNRQPYVVEIDNVACLAYYNYYILHNPISMTLIKYFLKSRYCKSIVCISEAARQSVLNTFHDKKIKEKCIVVYPYVKLKNVERKKHEKIIFLCCNRKFYMKGMLPVLIAFHKLNAQYKKDIELWMISDTSEDLKKKYAAENITFFEAKFSKEELYEKFYSKADVFVQPTLQDSFGLVYFEVMANKMAIISTDLFAIPEFVQHKKNGYLIPAPFYMFNKDFTPKKEFFPRIGSDLYPPANEDPVLIDHVYKAMLELIQNKEKLVDMQNYSFSLLQKSPFCEETRLQRLKQVCEKALD